MEKPEVIQNENVEDLELEKLKERLDFNSIIVNSIEELITEYPKREILSTNDDPKYGLETIVKLTKNDAEGQNLYLKLNERKKTDGYIYKEGIIYSSSKMELDDILLLVKNMSIGGYGQNSGISASGTISKGNHTYKTDINIGPSAAGRLLKLLGI